MSVNSYGHVIVGLKLENNAIRDLLYSEKEKNRKVEKGCNHNVPENVKFCPECGKPREKISYPEIYDNSPSEFIGFFIEDNNLVSICSTDNIDTFVTTSKKYTAQTDDIKASGGYDSVDVKGLDIELIKTELKEKLEPFGLWNEKNFKIWVVGYCSY